ncbi:unnamed protein product [Urochloa humidicola]
MFPCRMENMRSCCAVHLKDLFFFFGDGELVATKNSLATASGGAAPEHPPTRRQPTANRPLDMPVHSFTAALWMRPLQSMSCFQSKGYIEEPTKEDVSAIQEMKLTLPVMHHH